MQFTEVMGFLLTRPSRDVTNASYPIKPILIISTHTPLAGRDHGGRGNITAAPEFLLTRPSRDVTFSLRYASPASGFLLTRPSRDVTSLSFSDISKHGFLLTRPSRDVTSGREEW